MKKITYATLKKWNACGEEFEYLLDTFPEGADLQTMSKNLGEAGFKELQDWLWRKCSEDKDYCDQI